MSFETANRQGWTAASDKGIFFHMCLSSFVIFFSNGESVMGPVWWHLCKSCEYPLRNTAATCVYVARDSSNHAQFGFCVLFC